MVLEYLRYGEDGLDGESDVANKGDVERGPRDER